MSTDFVLMHDFGLLDEVGGGFLDRSCWGLSSCFQHILQHWFFSIQYRNLRTTGPLYWTYLYFWQLRTIQMSGLMHILQTAAPFSSSSHTSSLDCSFWWTSCLPWSTKTTRFRCVWTYPLLERYRTRFLKCMKLLDLALKSLKNSCFGTNFCPTFDNL